MSPTLGNCKGEKGAKKGAEAVERILFKGTSSHAARIIVRANRKSAPQSPGVVDHPRRMLLYSGARRIGFLAARHPLASFLPSMDIYGYDGAQLAEKSVGIFHRNLCRWFVGLLNHLCHDLFF